MSHIGQMLKEPRSYIRHPFIDPGSVYDGNVWDWDTYWSVYGLISLRDRMTPQLFARVLRHAKGNVLNFFNHQLPDGYVPMMVEDDGSGADDTYLNRKHREGVRLNMHKPFLAQQTLLISRAAGDFAWARPLADGLTRYLAYYQTYFHEHSGLYVWHDDIMIGMDNDPASFGRPPESTANIFLNSFMVSELEAAAQLYRQWGMEDAARPVEQRREALITAIRRECWDRRDRFYYSVDVDIHTRPYDWFHQGLGVFWRTLPIKIRAWSGFLPLLCGFADADEAAALRDHAMDEATFLADYGTCTLARDERMFDLRATNNPSNWLGPVWLVSSYCVSHGLRRYGYAAEADELARRAVSLLAKDLREHGCLHEYYDPFTGQPVMNGGFINWNILALTMGREAGMDA